MRRFRRFEILSLVGSVVLGSPAFADIKLPAVIGDNMVLQQGKEIPIWGTADAGEEVKVSFGGEAVTVKADALGRWSVKLGVQRAGGPHQLTVSGKNNITLKNVLVGEVWVASGQSNMWWPVRASANPDQEIAEAGFPKIRLFTVKQAIAGEPKQDCEGQWVECSPKAIPEFSAVAYFFGRDLHKALGVPVGMIHTSWGGTAAEAWTSRAQLEAEQELKPILDRWDQALANYPQEKEQFDKLLAKWKEAAEKAKAEGKEPPKQPQPPGDPAANPNRAAGLYNAMIAPLLPYAIQGAIWYQGESNASRAYQYRRLFPAMIQDWRRAWGQGDFSFLFVQLANFTQVQPEPGESDWAELREAQSMTLSLPKTGQAVIIDIGEANDIHPKNKQDVGHRLALAAQHVAYDKELVFSGPVYDSMRIEDSTICLKFHHVGGGLVVKGDGPVKGLAIAGEDHKFFWADATTDGDTVVVRSNHVEKPIAVRYAWANNPVCNLFNKEGLPASPFRTDDWPGATVNNK